MSKTRPILLGAAGALSLVGLLGTPALAATGRVVVFQTEVQPLSVYEDPSGCHAMPPLSHVLTNETDSPVRIYPDPFCLGPSTVVQPGYGSHVAPGAGSFSAD